MQITAITPQKRDRTRCNIDVDGRFCCGMKLETVVKSRLKVGDAVSTEYLADLQLESEKSTALDKALNHISRTPKTEKDVRTFLKGKGYLDDVSDYVIGKLKEYKYLDDREYARAYVEGMSKKKGKNLLAVELRRRGVPEAEIREALSEITNEDEGAAAVLQKYFKNKTVDQKLLTRAFTYLVGKGFDYETARAAVKKYVEELEEADE